VPEVSEQKADTDEVVADAGSKSRPDEQLLSKLTDSSEPQQPGTPAPEEKVETEAVQTPAPEDEQTRKNILDRLTGDSTDRSAEADKTDNSQAGGSGDA
jgi:hypothetical protein